MAKKKSNPPKTKTEGRAGQAIRESVEKQGLELYRLMVLVRKFEDKVLDLCRRNLVPGIAQLCQGQEATVVGTVFPLKATDYVCPTYRGHGHSIVKGTPLLPLMAEILGRATGCCKGKGGPMHLTDISVGNPGEQPVVGAHLPIACGLAFAAKRKGTNQVCLVDFGEGAVQAGIFHESLNLAALWKLPVVFVCENNEYAVSVPFRQVSPVPRVADRAAAYGMPACQVDGMNVFAVLEATTRALERARQGEGPTLLDCTTYRLVGHSQFDTNDGLKYRSQEELEYWRQRDPIAQHRQVLEKLGVASGRLDQIDEAARQEVEKAAEEALQAPWPQVEDAFSDLFAGP